MRRWTPALILILIVPANNDAQAGSAVITVDGCATLARAVYSEVSSSVLYGPGNAGPWLIEPGRGEMVKCEHVAETVSRAFTLGMGAAGVDVSWRRTESNGLDRSGRYCLSAFLSQCYPVSPRMSDKAAGETSTVVQKTWAIVAEAVMREMYNPFSSDEVSFRGNDLKLRLGLSLRSVDGSRVNRQSGH